MRGVLRPVVAVVLALFGTVVLAVAWTAATAVQLAATALIMGGTGHPLSTPGDDPVFYINPYMNNAVNGFINLAAATPAGTGGDGIAGVDPDDDRYAVVTPEQFFPVAGSMTFDRSVTIGRDTMNNCVRGTGCLYNDNASLNPQAPDGPPAVDDEFVVFGYSQSAVIASLVKRDLIENPGDTPATTSFFLLANPMRPNGGILARGFRGLTIPILGVTFHGATPTNSCDEGNCMPTVDAAVQYDLLGGDAPASFTNVLAWLNSLAAYVLLHGPLQDANFGDALYQGSYGDTDYYLYPSKRLPLLMPLEPFIPSPILTFLDAPLRAAIEGGYARGVNPGIATGLSLLPFGDPVQTIVNIIRAIPVGIDDALAEVAGDPTFRPLGTKPVTSPFGVGGPELPEAPEEPEETEEPDEPDEPAEPEEPEKPEETVLPSSSITDGEPDDSVGGEETAPVDGEETAPVDDEVIDDETTGEDDGTAGAEDEELEETDEAVEDITDEDITDEDITDEDITDEDITDEDDGAGEDDADDVDAEAGEANSETADQGGESSSADTDSEAAAA